MEVMRKLRNVQAACPKTWNLAKINYEPSENGEGNVSEISRIGRGKYSINKGHKNTRFLLNN